MAISFGKAYRWQSIRRRTRPYILSSSCWKARLQSIRRDDVWWFSSAEGNISVSVRGRFRANNAAAVYRAVLNGRGIALVSHLLVLEDIQKGRLQALMPEFPSRSFTLSVVYPSRRNLPLRTRAVIEFLTEVVRADTAMSNLGIIANEALEPEVPGAGESLSAS